MKQVFNISRYSVHWGLFFLWIFIPQLLFSQEDSTRVIRDSVQVLPAGGFDSMINPVPDRVEFPLYLDPPGQRELGNLPTYSFKKELHLPYHVDTSPLFRGDFSTGGIMWQHRHGAIFGTGAQETVPGIGRFNEASVGYGHVFNDRFSMQLSADAMKINMINFVGETFSTSGRLSYRASDVVAFNVFGTYNIGNSYGVGAADRYGATVSVVMSDHFRMEVGAQRYYNTMRGRWETVPVAIPTYRFDNGFELGLDVGGIIYEILRNTVFDSNQRNQGPTIAPPRFEMQMR